MRNNARILYGVSIGLCRALGPGAAGTPPLFQGPPPVWTLTGYGGVEITTSFSPRPFLETIGYTFNIPQRQFGIKFQMQWTYNGHKKTLKASQAFQCVGSI